MDDHLATLLSRRIHEITVADYESNNRTYLAPTRKSVEDAVDRSKEYQSYPRTTNRDPRYTEAEMIVRVEDAVRADRLRTQMGTERYLIDNRVSLCEAAMVMEDPHDDGYADAVAFNDGLRLAVLIIKGE